jgi:hypothetical protein
MGANDPDRVLPSEDGIAQDLAEAACIENGARDVEDRSSAPCETHGVNLTRVGRWQLLLRTSRRHPGIPCIC